ncbi:MAG: HD domain-containing phosphohydrolase, partial [Bacillota bacterium]
GLAVNTILLFVFFEGGWYFAWQISDGILVTLMVCFGFGLFINSYENLEYRLKRSQKKYKTLFEAIGSTVAVIKKDGTISVINQQGEKLLGYQKDELEQEKSYFDFVAPQDRNRVQEQHQKVMGAKTKGPFSYEFTLIDKQGSYKQVDVTENLVLDTNSSVASIIDITERKEMTEQIKRNKDKLEKLHQIVFKMSQINQEEEVYELIVDTIMDILEFTSSVVLLNEDNYLSVEALTGGIEVQDISVSEGLAGKTYQEQETLFIKDLEKNEFVNLSWDNAEEIISTPLGNLGVLQVISEKPGWLSSADLKLIELLANHTTEAIKRIHSQNEIKYISFHDTLTGLYNRAYVEQAMDRLSSQENLPISIIAADVNGLKLVNDAFGHDIGDKLLIKTGQILEGSCRAEDIVARLGGDEFIILLPQTGKEKVMLVKDRILKNCAEVSSLPVPLSIAIGQVTKEIAEEELWEVYKKADERMYNDKVSSKKEVEKKLIQSLLTTLNDKSAETFLHNLRLQRIGFKFGEQLNLAPQKLEKIRLLIMVHDIGKVTIAEEILTKPGNLSKQEWITIKGHAKTGYQIVSTTDKYAPVAAEILYHHEHWDGSGYPEGLVGEEIPLLARIMAIIDAYEVMSTGRLYQEKMTVKEARQELKKKAGTQFDPDLVDVFLNSEQMLEN